MIIHSEFTDGPVSIEAITEIEKDCISVSFFNNTTGVNVCINKGRITVYVYPQDATPEIIDISAR